MSFRSAGARASLREALKAIRASEYWRPSIFLTPSWNFASASGVLNSGTGLVGGGGAGGTGTGAGTGDGVGWAAPPSFSAPPAPGAAGRASPFPPDFPAGEAGPAEGLPLESPLSCPPSAGRGNARTSTTTTLRLIASTSGRGTLSGRKASLVQTLTGKGD